MAADLQITIIDAEQEMVVNKYRDGRVGAEKLFKAMSGDLVWIGEVSWLKAAFGEEAEFIPGPVAAVNTIIGYCTPVTIDDEIIEAISAAMNVPNTTSYSIADPAKVVGFLNRHKGQRCFGISV